MPPTSFPAFWRLLTTLEVFALLGSPGAYAQQTGRSKHFIGQCLDRMKQTLDRVAEQKDSELSRLYTGVVIGGIGATSSAYFLSLVLETEVEKYIIGKLQKEWLQRALFLKNVKPGSVMPKNWLSAQFSLENIEIRESEIIEFAKKRLEKIKTVMGNVSEKMKALARNPNKPKVLLSGVEPSASRGFGAGRAGAGVDDVVDLSGADSKAIHELDDLMPGLSKRLGATHVPLKRADIRALADQAMELSKAPEQIFVDSNGKLHVPNQTIEELRHIEKLGEAATSRSVKNLTGTAVSESTAALEKSTVRAVRTMNTAKWLRNFARGGLAVELGLAGLATLLQAGREASSTAWADQLRDAPENLLNPQRAPVQSFEDPFAVHCDTLRDEPKKAAAAEKKWLRHSENAFQEKLALRLGISPRPLIPTGEHPPFAANGKASLTVPVSFSLPSWALPEGWYTLNTEEPSQGETESALKSEAETGTARKPPTNSSVDVKK